MNFLDSIKKVLILHVKLLFRDDNGSLQDKCSLFHSSPRQQLEQKKNVYTAGKSTWNDFDF